MKSFFMIVCILMGGLFSLSLYAGPIKDITPKTLLHEVVTPLGRGKRGQGVVTYRFRLYQKSKVTLELFFDPTVSMLELALYKEGESVFLERSRYHPEGVVFCFKTKAQEGIFQILDPGSYLIKVSETNRQENIYNLRLVTVPIGGGVVIPQKERPVGDLLTAIQQKKVAEAISMIEQGADVNQMVPLYGYSLLHLAIMLQQNEVVLALLQKGAKVHVVTKDLSTPLHFAVAQGDLELVELLVDYGASVLSKNIQGETPVDVAKRKHFDDIVDFLSKVTIDHVTLSKEKQKRYLELLEMKCFSEEEILSILKKEFPEGS